MEKWNIVAEESEKNYQDRENITQIQNRIYVERASNPLKEKLSNLKILELELILWDGINLGSHEYFQSLSKVFNDIEGVWFMGQYGPANDPYNWAHCFMYDSISRMTEMDVETFKSVGRPKNAIITVEKIYKRIKL